MGEGLADAVRGGERDEDVVAAVVGSGRREVKTTRNRAYSPTTCGATASRGRQQVARVGG